MKYYLIAGEPSGDLHGSNLMKAILEFDPQAEFRFWGGDHMLSVSEGIVTHIRETSIMGFTEVVQNLGKIRRFFAVAKASIDEFRPDKIIYIDYPGFNLRMAEWSKKSGYHNTYYISPQLWAWKKGRVHKVRQYVDAMLCILPFEKAFYASYAVDVHYVGHPLISVVSEFEADPEFRVRHSINEEKQVLAILPGSRKQEIGKLLPTYIDAALTLADDYHLLLATAPNVDLQFYYEIIGARLDRFTIIENDTYNILSIADLAVVTSGTATLETALFDVPQVICYKTSSINYSIGKLVVDLKYIGLVNLISNKMIVEELIQNEVDSKRIALSLRRTVDNALTIKGDYQQMRALLSHTQESASRNAAHLIVTS